MAIRCKRADSGHGDKSLGIMDCLDNEKGHNYFDKKYPVVLKFK